MTLPPRNFSSKKGRDGRLRSAIHRRFVAQHLCILWERKDCDGPVECCHNRDEAPRNQRHGGKPDDTFCYSACRKHHREAEKRESAFGRKYGINVLAACLEFAAASPDRMIREAAKQYAGPQRLLPAVNIYSSDLILAARDFPEKVRRAYRDWPQDWLEGLFKLAASASSPSNGATAPAARRNTRTPL